jgi:hypothetical protein
MYPDKMYIESKMYFVVLCRILKANTMCYNCSKPTALSQDDVRSTSARESLFFSGYTKNQVYVTLHVYIPLNLRIEAVHIHLVFGGQYGTERFMYCVNLKNPRLETVYKLIYYDI